MTIICVCVYSKGYIYLYWLIKEMLSNKTSIIIENSTRNELRGIGRKEQTYDQVIKELIEIKQNLRYGIKNSDSLEYQSSKPSSSESDYP